jgi:hypothetical protein
MEQCGNREVASPLPGKTHLLQREKISPSFPARPRMMKHACSRFGLCRSTRYVWLSALRLPGTPNPAHIAKQPLTAQICAIVGISRTTFASWTIEQSAGLKDPTSFFLHG